MAQLRIVVSHQLPKEEAINRIKNLLSNTSKKYADEVSDVEEQWSGDTAAFSFKVKRLSAKVNGTIEVSDREIVLDGKIPPHVVPFKDRIVDMVRGRAVELLA